MASPNSIFTEIVTTTFRNHRSEIADNFSKHNAVYRKLAKGNKVRKESGGYKIATPLEYAANSTYQRYSGFETLNVGASDVFTAAEYDWRQIAINVVSSGYELRVNQGAQRIANLAKAKIRNAINTFANNFSSDMYSDGAATNQIDGLQKIIAATPTNTVGGISGNTWTFWKNIVQSAASPLGGGSAVTPGTTTNGMQLLMNELFMKLTRGADKPDLITASDNYFGFYEAELVGQKRYVSEDMADGGFMALSYKGVPVLFDGSSGHPASSMYFINSNYLEVVVHSDANLTVMDEAKPYNQDAVVVPILWMGNLVCSNRSLQGLLKA